MRLSLRFTRVEDIVKDERFLAQQIALEAKAKIMQKALAKGETAGNIIVEDSTASLMPATLKNTLTPNRSDLFVGS